MLLLCTVFLAESSLGTRDPERVINEVKLGAPFFFFLNLNNIVFINIVNPEYRRSMAP